jgi:hypothetical protein
LSQTLTEQDNIVRKCGEQGLNLVNQLKNLQRKTNQFNLKYIAQISEKKKDDGVIGFFKNKLTFAKGEKAPVLPEPVENISVSQIQYNEALNQKNIDRLLAE